MFKYLLFDADNTIFDFFKSEEIALHKTLESFGISYCPEHHQTYTKINDQAWKALEKKLITIDEVKIVRFRNFIAHFGFNIQAEVMNSCYLEFLSQSSEFMAGAVEMLDKFKEMKKFYTLVLITNGLSKVQRGRLRVTGADKYFDKVIISEEIGVQKPDVRYFKETWKQIGNPPLDEILLIGDSLTSDIQCAVNSGIKSCLIDWKNKYDGKEPIPDYLIHNLEEIWRII